MTEIEIERGRERRVVPFGASKLSRAALHAISAGPRGPGRESMHFEGDRLVLYWKGSTPVQLALPWTEPGFAALQVILQALKEDGVRDWLILHRLAAEQGRTGDFAWLWAEHRQRSL